MESNGSEAIQKRVAFYASLVNAWIQTRMEVDKTLIVISSAGIGFLITLLNNKGFVSTTGFIVYLSAFFSFFVVIILCIVILQRNSSYILTLLNNPDAKDPYLGVIDHVAKFFFALALIFTLIIGISIGVDQLHKSKNSKGDQKMTESKAKEILKKVEESLKGVDKLDSSKIETESLDGLGDLNPDKSTDSTSTNTGSDQSTNDKKK